MNKKQYNNVIENTLKQEQADDSLSTARAIFDNMGVALPQGDMKTVYETIKTDNYMGWKSCTMLEAQAAADAGTAAIGISQDKIVVLSATDEEQPVAQTASVMTLTENTSAFAVDGLQYYSYGYGTTNHNPLYFSNSNLNVDVGWTGYNILYGASTSTVYWTTSNPNIMKVDYYSGHLQAVGVGSAWITATTSNGYSAEFHVEIEKLVKYVTVEETIVRDLLFGENDIPGITVQSYPVLLRLFYNITKIDNNRVFLESVSAFAKYDRNVVIFGVEAPSIGIANISIGNTSLNLQENNILASPDWIYDAKISNVNQWVTLGTELSTKATLMCHDTIYPYAEVNAETHVSI